MLLLWVVLLSWVVLLCAAVVGCVAVCCCVLLFKVPCARPLFCMFVCLFFLLVLCLSTSFIESHSFIAIRADYIHTRLFFVSFGILFYLKELTLAEFAKCTYRFHRDQGQFSCPIISTSPFRAAERLQMTHGGGYPDAKSSKSGPIGCRSLVHLAEGTTKLAIRSLGHAHVLRQML